MKPPLKQGCSSPTLVVQMYTLTILLLKVAKLCQRPSSVLRGSCNKIQFPTASGKVTSSCRHSFHYKRRLILIFFLFQFFSCFPISDNQFPNFLFPISFCPQNLVVWQIINHRCLYSKNSYLPQLLSRSSQTTNISHKDPSQIGLHRNVFHIITRLYHKVARSQHDFLHFWENHNSALQVKSREGIFLGVAGCEIVSMATN